MQTTPLSTQYTIWYPHINSKNIIYTLSITGTTVLNHNQEVRNFINGYEDVRSYTRDITYDNGLDFAKAVADISGSCYQHLKVSLLWMEGLFRG